MSANDWPKYRQDGSPYIGSWLDALPSQKRCQVCQQWVDSRTLWRHNQDHAEQS